MTKKQRAKLIVERLEQAYPDAVCSLEYENPHELLVSVRLAAQCTDARVNEVTPILFAQYPTLESLAQADPAAIADIVRPCGLGNTKARDIVACCKMLIEQFGGRVPDTMAELLSLPGVGRKSANLIMGDVYGLPAVVCDTHCIRITGLMGLSSGSKNAAIVERELWAILDPEKASDFCHRIVIHGREVCRARAPRCDGCCVSDLCKMGIGK